MVHSNQVLPATVNADKLERSPCSPSAHEGRCAHTHTHICTHMQAQTHIQYTCTCAHSNAHTHACMRTHTYNTCIHTYVHMHAHTRRGGSTAVLRDSKDPPRQSRAETLPRSPTRIPTLLVVLSLETTSSVEMGIFKENLKLLISCSFSEARNKKVGR